MFATVSMMTAVVAATLTMGQPTDVAAQVAAQVESQTRPNFGVLLDPPTRTRPSGRNRRWSSNWRPGHHGPSAPRPPYGSEEVVLIDCGGNPGSGGIESAVRRVRPGGTLIIRSTGGPCVGLLQIDRPMTVIGDVGFDLRHWDRNDGPTLQAADITPCVFVAPGVSVTFRDVIFASPRAGDAACLVGYDANILLSRTGFRHAGDKPAIYAEGGSIDIRDSRIEAATLSAAIVVDGTTLTTDEVLIGGAVSGIEMTSGDGPVSRINRTRIIGSEQNVSYGPRPVGLMIQAGRQQDLVHVTNSKICGYPDGVILEGAKFRIDHSRICDTEQAITLYGGDALIENSRIVARELGVVAIGGTATVRRNIFAQVFAPVDEARGGRIVAEDNQVWSSEWSGCTVGYEQRYGNRYEPVWNRGSGSGQGFTCRNSPYPRDWWAQDEEAQGVPYDDRVNFPQNYNQFQRGRGWYQCRGYYVDSDRYQGDDRWSRGSMGWSDECPRRPGQPRWSGGARANAEVWLGDIDFRTGFDFEL